jgi:hypothetical protein
LSTCRHGHEVDAVFEQDVTHEWQIGGRGFGGDLLVVGGDPTIGVDSGAHPVYRHGTKPAAIEFLLSG